jgi:hypothetical protein
MFRFARAVLLSRSATSPEAHPNLIEALSRDDILAMANKSLSTHSEGDSR